MADEVSKLGAVVEGRCVFENQVLFDNLRLELVAGGWTCLLGASGVGKTTLLRILAGLETGGTFEGRVSTSDGGPVAGRAAYMGQTDLLAPWLTVRGNVALGATLRAQRADDARAMDLIERVGLIDREHAKPHELSGGMRQRVALARTLMEDKPFALLDEPFSALDAGTRAAMQELTFTLLCGRTVLLITHDPAEAARLGERVFVMHSNGLSEPRRLASSPIRAVDDDETLRAQADLLAAVRASMSDDSAK